MEGIIRAYFQSWIDNNIEVLKETFVENAVYSECYGPEYHGLSQLIRWFEDWHKSGNILAWDIKRVIEKDRTVIVEWHFKCVYDGEISEFDGVTIADFNEENKISKLCEFESKSEHYYPYG